jgi:DNA replication licensing factor MCM4
MQGMAGMEPSSNTQVLYGTNINSNEVQQKLRNFLTTYIHMTDDDEDYGKEPFYVQRLREIHEMESYILDVDCEHLFEFDQSLYRQVENYPTDIIPIFDLVVTHLYRETFILSYNGGAGGMGGAGDSEGMDQQNNAADDGPIIQVRPFNMRTHHRIRDLDPSHIDKLVSIKGIVIRNSDIIPEMKEASFKCSNCGNPKQEFIQRGRIIEPDFCENCKKRYTFTMVHNACYFSDKQHVKM